MNRANIPLLVGVNLATKPMTKDHVDKFVERSKAPLEEIGDLRTSRTGVQEV